MVLRNVPSTATFEEQRVEINELAADVEALDAAALKAESDTLQSVTDRGFTTDNPIKIENYAATAFVVEDNSSNEKFVVDSVNGKVNVGSSAGGASGLYVFHNNSGATPAITLDGATATGTFGGDVEIGGTSGSPNTKLYSSGSAEFAGGVDLAATNVNGSSINTFGGFTVQGSNGLRIVVDGYNQTTNTVRILTDGSATFSNTVTGKQTSNNALSAFEAVDTNGTRFKVTGAGVLSLYDNSLTENVTISSDGSATFNGTTIVGSDPDVTSNSGCKLYTSGTIRARSTSSTSSGILFEGFGAGQSSSQFKVTADGAATFAGQISTSSIVQTSRFGTNVQLGASSEDAFRIGSAASGTLRLKYDGSGSFGDASNSTGNNGVLIGGNNGSLNIYTDRYSTDCFQIVNTTGSGTNVTLKAFGNGNLEIAGTLDVGSNVNLNDSTVDLYSQTTNPASKTFQLFSDIGGTKVEKFYIRSDGTVEASDTITSPFIKGSGADGTSADTALFQNLTSGGDNRVRINTYANGGGDPYIKFDAGGSNFVVGEEYNGTTNNKLVLGVGETPSGVTGIYVNGNGQTVIGSYAMNSEQLRVKGAEADIWLDSDNSGTWRILGSTGGNTHQFRVYDNTNSADRLTISSTGRVRVPGIVGVAGSNIVNVSVESDGNLVTTTSIRAAKTNISTLADTSWLFDLNPVTFNWRTKTENEDGTLSWGEDADGGTQYGLIAEEVKEVNDDFCYYNNDGELTGVHYDRLVAPLLKVVQQQKEQIEALEARLDAAGL